MSKPPALWVAAIAFAMPAVLLGGCGGGGAKHNGKTATTTPTTTTTGPVSGGSALTPGQCGPDGCRPAAVTRYNLNVPDSDATGCGVDSCGSPATVAPPIFISRPAGLLTSSPAPLVIAFDGSIGGDPQWRAAAATDKFVYVSLRSSHDCQGPSGCEYAAVSTARDKLGVGVDCSTYPGQRCVRPFFQSCGRAGNVSCDDIPWVRGVITALEKCTMSTSAYGHTVGDWVAGGDAVPSYANDPRSTSNGAPPCQKINPKEVFVEGGSRGGGMALDTACDTRTSTILAGAVDLSDTMVSSDPSGATLPNCPALLGVNHTTCVADCVSAPRNTKLLMQFVWGDEDPNFPVSPSICDRTVSANDCAGVGYRNPAARSWGNIQLATTVFGAALGCATSPSSVQTGLGQTGKIEVATYAGGCHRPGAATQTIRVMQGAHMPDTWPFGQTRGIACVTDCNDLNNSDGLVGPIAAWAFWSRYFAR